MEPLVGVRDGKGSEPELRNLIIGLGDGLASMMGRAGQPMKVSEAEAQTVSKPASRILARNPTLDRTVQIVTDPLALIIATAGLVFPRYLYAQMVFTGVKPMPPPQTFHQSPPQQAPPPPPPPRAPGESMPDDAFTTLCSKFADL